MEVNDHDMQILTKKFSYIQFDQFFDDLQVAGQHYEGGLDIDDEDPISIIYHLNQKIRAETHLELVMLQKMEADAINGKNESGNVVGYDPATAKELIH